MAFIVETGSGTPGANAYVPVAFVTDYLAARGRSTENGWDALSDALRKAAIVKATDYIEQRWGPEFLGEKANLDVVGREAVGSLDLTAPPLDGEELVVGQKTYRLVSALAQENDVLIGVDAETTVANLVSAINVDGDTDVYDSATLTNYEVVAYADVEELVIAARTTGDSGNLIAFSTDITGATISGTGFLEGGVDEGEQPLSFPRVELYSNDGRAVVGIPLKLKMATAEYAVRAVAAALHPDPTVDPRYLPVTKKREKVGPIEEETTYGAASAYPIVPYPAADNLLAEYVAASGQSSVIRG